MRRPRQTAGHRSCIDDSASYDSYGLFLELLGGTLGTRISYVHSFLLTSLGSVNDSDQQYHRTGGEHYLYNTTLKCSCIRTTHPNTSMTYLCMRSVSRVCL